MGSVAQTGRTVLFVSHNMLAMEDLCDRVIWLKDGRVFDEGQPEAVVSNYLQETFSVDTERFWEDRSTAPGTENVRLRRVCVRPLHGSSRDPITVRTSFEIEIEYWNLRQDAYFSPSIALYNEQGIVVFTSSPPFEPEESRSGSAAGLYRHVLRVPGDLLNDGIHQVALYIGRNQRTEWKQDEILIFEVQDTVEMRHGWHGKWGGAVRPMLNWSKELVQPEFPRKVRSKSQLDLEDT
jgi:lipopolysaccharide transport system ATP-binding protein